MTCCKLKKYSLFPTKWTSIPFVVLPRFFSFGTLLMPITAECSCLFDRDAFSGSLGSLRPSSTGKTVPLHLLGPNRRVWPTSSYAIRDCSDTCLISGCMPASFFPESRPSRHTGSSVCIWELQPRWEKQKQTVLKISSIKQLSNSPKPLKKTPKS